MERKGRVVPLYGAWLGEGWEGPNIHTLGSIARECASGMGEERFAETSFAPRKLTSKAKTHENTKSTLLLTEKNAPLSVRFCFELRDM